VADGSAGGGTQKATGREDLEKTRWTISFMARLASSMPGMGRHRRDRPQLQGCRRGGNKDTTTENDTRGRKGRAGEGNRTRKHPVRAGPHDGGTKKKCVWKGGEGKRGGKEDGNVLTRFSFHWGKGRFSQLSAGVIGEKEGGGRERGRAVHWFGEN